MIRAVLFDVGGPLDLEIRYEDAIDADIRKGLNREGFELTDEAWLAANQFAVDSFSPNAYRSVIWQLSGNDVTAPKRIYEWMERQAHERSLFDLRPGIGDVLEALKARGLKLGLAANQPARALQHLADHNIGHYFGNEGISAVYGLRKPDVRLFLRACEDLDVQPADCIMVGDRIDNDIVPPKLLGMKTVLLRTGRHLKQQPRSWDEIADREVHDSAGILAAVLELVESSSR